jgi:hypothetical protein
LSSKTFNLTNTNSTWVTKTFNLSLKHSTWTKKFNLIKSQLDRKKINLDYKSQLDRQKSTWYTEVNLIYKSQLDRKKVNLIYKSQLDWQSRLEQKILKLGNYNIQLEQQKLKNWASRPKLIISHTWQAKILVIACITI